MGPNPIFLVALEGEDMWTRRDSGGAHSQRDDRVRTQGEGGPCKPRRGASEEITANTFILGWKLIQRPWDEPTRSLGPPS